MLGLAIFSPLCYVLPKPTLSISISTPRRQSHVKTLADRRRRSPSLLRRSSEPLSPSSPGDGDAVPPDPGSFNDDGFEAEIEKVEGKNNRRRIWSRIPVNADLETVWRVLTDYEGLATFIPSLSVSQLIHKGDGFARLYQVGQQNLGLGLKFNAKAVLDCVEGGLESVPSGRRRDIEFKMVEGDFQMFEGRWSIEQVDNETYENSECISEQEFQTTLSYFVELEPKPWLPVRLLEGRICREIKLNLQCVQEEARRVQNLGNEAFSTWEIIEDDNLTGTRS